MNAPKRMCTINRRPIKTHIRFDGDVVIDWKCHGIDQHGNRQRWTERTFTTAVFVETYDPELFSDHIDYRTTKFIFPPGKFEHKKETS